VLPRRIVRDSLERMLTAMIRMLTLFNLPPSRTLEDFQDALADFSRQMLDLDLIDSVGPVARRYSDTLLDTENRRLQFMFDMHFRDRIQTRQAIEYIVSTDAAPPGVLHLRLQAMIKDPVFSCWEDS
jgi:hypothetical protein